MGGAAQNFERCTLGEAGFASDCTVTYVPSTRLRLKRRGQDVVARLFTLPQDHPIQSVLERASRRAVAKGNNPRLPTDPEDG